MHAAKCNRPYGHRIVLSKIDLLRRNIVDMSHRPRLPPYGRREIADKDGSGERLTASAKAGGVLCDARMCSASSIPTVDIPETGPAEANGPFQHSLKNHLQFARRRADDTQNFRRCRL